MSRRSWIRTKPTAASRSTRTIARLFAARAAVAAIRWGSPGCSPAGPLGGAIEVPYELPDPVPRAIGGLVADPSAGCRASSDEWLADPCR